MPTVPPSIPRRWDTDETCRQCYEPMAFVWFRPTLYNFHQDVLKRTHVFCQVCGKCKCGLRADWSEPPKEYTPI